MKSILKQVNQELNELYEAQELLFEVKKHIGDDPYATRKLPQQLHFKILQYISNISEDSE